MPILYSFRRCPYAMRARLAVLASQQTVELREVVLARKPMALLEASPKGTVPVLVLDDGAVVEQSLDIMLWALKRHDPQRWLPANDHAWQLANNWIGHNDGPFKRQLDRYKYPNRHGLANGNDERNAAANWLAGLNTTLTQQTYLAGPYFGLADAALAPFIRQFAHTSLEWFGNQPWPALQAWLARFEQSEAFARVMYQYAAWEPGTTASHFPMV